MIPQEAFRGLHVRHIRRELRSSEPAHTLTVDHISITPRFTVNDQEALQSHVDLDVLGLAVRACCNICSAGKIPIALNAGHPHGDFSDLPVDAANYPMCTKGYGLQGQNLDVDIVTHTSNERTLDDSPCGLVALALLHARNLQP